MDRIGVLFNCQSVGLANGFRAIFPSSHVVSFTINSMEENRNEILSELRSCDVVFSLPPQHVNNFVPYDVLSSNIRKLCVLPPIIFSGFHPDSIYWSDCPKLSSSAVGPYHSRVIVAGYLGTLSVSETATLFNRLVYQRLGYFDAFGASVTFITGIFRTYGIDLKYFLDRWISRGCFMHSVNHPKSFVLGDLALAGCQIAGLLPVEDDAARFEMLPDSLAHHPKFPLLPEIAENIGLRGHKLFKAHSSPLDGSRVELLSIEEFIERSFGAYDAIAPDVLLAGDGVRSACLKLGITSSKLDIKKYHDSREVDGLCGEIRARIAERDETYVISGEVTNTGSSVWRPSGADKGAVNIGLLVRDSRGVFHHDFQRALFLKESLDPNSSHSFSIEIEKAKVDDGELYVDLVSEQVAWFSFPSKPILKLK